MSISAKQKKFISQLLWLVVADIFLESFLPIIAGLPIGYVMVPVLFKALVYHLIAYSVYLYLYDRLLRLTTNKSALITFVVLTVYLITWILLFIRVMYYGDFNEFESIYKVHGEKGLFMFLRIYFTHNSSIFSALLLFPAHHLINMRVELLKYKE